MKKVKQFFSVAAVAGITALMGVASAEAGTAIGKITKIDDYGTYAYVYIAAPSTGTSTGAISYCYTTANQQVILAAAAAAGGIHVMLWGNGSANTGYLGSCTYVDVLGLY